MNRRPLFAAALASDQIEHFILQDHTVAACTDRIARSFGIPLIRGGPISDSEIAKVARDPYIRKALQSTLIRGLQLELFFTYLRKSLLRLASETVDSDILVLFSALAQQCFINEYVYLIGDDEALQIAKWRELIEERMADGNSIEPFILFAVAAYLPLYSLSTPERLFKQKWSPAIVELLTQQIREPLEEIRERNSIPAITPIVDSTSLQVRHQYEQNPYPRRTKLPPVGRRIKRKWMFSLPAAARGSTSSTLLFKIQRRAYWQSISAWRALPMQSAKSVRNVWSISNLHRLTYWN